MSEITEAEAARRDWMDHEYTQMKLKVWKDEKELRLKGLKLACDETADANVARAYGKLLAAEEQINLLEGKHGST